MTHLTYIIAAYGVFVVIAVWFSTASWTRMTRARKRLAAIDPRASR
jgi:hypothetical protein